MGGGGVEGNWVNVQLTATCDFDIQLYIYRKHRCVAEFKTIKMKGGKAM